VRTITIDRTFFNISSTATVKLYECDKYGNPLNSLLMEIYSTPISVSLNCDTSSFITPSNNVLARYALYMLEVTENQLTKKISLFIFDGEGDLSLLDITSPFYYQSIFTHLFYTGGDLPIVLQDFIEKLDAWLGDTTQSITPSNYKESIESLMLFAEYETAQPSYFKAQCLTDLDAVLAQR